MIVQTTRAKLLTRPLSCILNCRDLNSQSSIMQWLPIILWTSISSGSRSMSEPSDYFISCADQLFHLRLYSSADVFHKAEEDRKQEHSNILSALLCITHVLPLACKSEGITSLIFSRNGTQKHNFHARWTWDGWNDHIIQPARDAVLGYYRVRIPIIWDLYIACAKTHTNKLYSFVALRKAIRRRRVHASQ